MAIVISASTLLYGTLGTLLVSLPFAFVHPGFIGLAFVVGFCTACLAGLLNGIGLLALAASGGNAHRRTSHACVGALAALVTMLVSPFLPGGTYDNLKFDSWEIVVGVLKFQLMHNLQWPALFLVAVGAICGLLLNSWVASWLLPNKQTNPDARDQVARAG